MNYSNLSEHQLLTIATKNKTHNKEINIEWRKRYAMNFPYKLSIDSSIMNCLIGALVGDRECDKLILDQANSLRDRRGSK